MLEALILLRVLLFALENLYEPQQMLSCFIFMIRGCLAGAIPFGSVYLWCPERIGGGDVKLMSVIGLYLGATQTLEAMFFSLCYSAAYLLGKTWKERRRCSGNIPFAPFVLLGTITVMVIVRNKQWKF